MRLTRLLSISLAILLGTPVSGYAAPAPQPTTRFQLEQFEPSPLMAHDILNVSTSDVMSHLDFSAGLLFHYASSPLSLRRTDDPNTVVSSLVDDQLKAELALALGLFDAVAIGFVLPASIYQNGDDLAPIGLSGQTIPSAGLQDGRFVIKARLLNPEKAGGFGISLTAPIYIPFGDEEGFGGDGEVRVKPSLALEYRDPESFVLALNAGFSFRPDRPFHDYTSGYGIPLALGTEIYTGHTPLSIMATAFTTLGISDSRDPAALEVNLDRPGDRGIEFPIEVLAGLRYRFSDQWSAQAGAGAGLTRGVGTPSYRAFAGLAFTPSFAATEVSDDLNPHCPDKPANYSGPVDANNCPTNPHCPDKPANYAGPVDAYDCPVNPLCPDKPANYRGAVDADGCPINPYCPDMPRDYDGDLDLFGCPVNPHCPDMNRRYRGPLDDNGCPAVETENVKIEEDKIVILKRVFFALDSDEIKEESHAILDEVAQVLIDNFWITSVRVDGHTDNQGAVAYNERLSARRAESVRQYLISKGVAASTLESKGFGESQPIADNANEDGRAANRRVEFTILTIRDEPVSHTDDKRIEHIDNLPTTTE